jgi:hypothetical protein
MQEVNWSNSTDMLDSVISRFEEENVSCVCMYACICVCTFWFCYLKERVFGVCVYVCIHAHRFHKESIGCKSVCMHAHVYILEPTKQASAVSMYVCLHMCMCIRMVISPFDEDSFSCMNVINVCVYIYLYTHTHTNRHCLHVGPMTHSYIPTTCTHVQREWYLLYSKNHVSS